MIRTEGAATVIPTERGGIHESSASSTGCSGSPAKGGDASSTTTKTCRAKRERAEAEAGAAIGGAGSATPTTDGPEPVRVVAGE